MRRYVAIKSGLYLIHRILKTDQDSDLTYVIYAVFSYVASDLIFGQNHHRYSYDFSITFIAKTEKVFTLEV